jgi:hypothetical protein
VKQVLYHPFCSGYFGDGGFVAQASLDQDSLHFTFPIITTMTGKFTWMGFGTKILLISASQVTGMICVNHCTQLLVEMGSHRLFTLAGLEL